MPRHVDALTSATLKNLREQWWDAEFSEFLRDTLRPRPGNRILDVGCGEGTAELSLGRLRVSQLRLYAIDRQVERVRHTASAARSHNFRLGLAAADVRDLPFRDGAFDATFCVAVLQHVNDVPRAVRELARVTRPGGRVLAVEPDNSARYWYCSSAVGARAFELGSRFFGAVAQARGDATDSKVGPRLSTLFPAHGLEPLAIELFPVSVSHIGTPPPGVWEARRESAADALARTPTDALADLAEEYRRALDDYEAEARRAGPSFVEIQNTMLFATVGQRTEAAAGEPAVVGAGQVRDRTYE